MAVFNVANLKKTIYYLRRNGVKSTWNAARERMGQARNDSYEWEEPSLLELQAGKEYCRELIEDLQKEGRQAPAFSILVPAYRTDPLFLKELVESVKAQIYPNWELLILDASEDESVQDALKELCIVKGIPFTEEKPSQESPETGRGQEHARAADEQEHARAADEQERARTASEQERAEAGREPERPEETGRRAWRAGAVRYVRLPGNRGISENTNAGLPLALGSYIGLLDHDDVLTADALQCMADAVLENGPRAKLLYSDEDKWNGEAKGYYEPNFKEDFNLDLLLSNNYICHFLVMEASLFQELGLRSEYDGAQDYDLVLRAAEKILAQEPHAGIVHIPRVLYHWRCHRASTAENPGSKAYAYEAGRRALQDYADRQGISARAVNLKHVGFYRLEYHGAGTPQAAAKAGREKAPDPREIFKSRPDLAAVGGRVTAGKAYRKTREEEARYPGIAVQKGSLIGGRMDREGNVFYYGLKSGYSGYLHRAVLTQDAEAVDLRCICVAGEDWELFQEVVGVPYQTQAEGPWFDSETLPAQADPGELGRKFGEALRARGRRILWDPAFSRSVGKG